MKTVRLSVALCSAIMASSLSMAAENAPDRVDYDTTVVNSLLQCPREMIAQAPTDAFVRLDGAYWTRADGLMHIRFSKIAKTVHLPGVDYNEMVDVADVQIHRKMSFDGTTMHTEYECRLVAFNPPIPSPPARTMTP